MKNISILVDVARPLSATPFSVLFIIVKDNNFKFVKVIIFGQKYDLNLWRRFNVGCNEVHFEEHWYFLRWHYWRKIELPKSSHVFVENLELKSCLAHSIYLFLLLSNKTFYRRATVDYELHFLDDTAIFLSWIRQIFLEEITENLVLFVRFCLPVFPRYDCICWTRNVSSAFILVTT